MGANVYVPDGTLCSSCHGPATGIWGAGKAGGIFMCEPCANKLDGAYMIDSLEGVHKVVFGFEALSDQGCWYYTNIERLREANDKQNG